MAKIGERVIYDENEKKYIVQKTHDFTFGEEYAKHMSQTNGGIIGENRLVGTIPNALIGEWCKEAGISFEDVEARKDVIKRKILSGDFDKFRVWKGKY